jgi:electron transport protein HydN
MACPFGAIEVFSSGELAENSGAPCLVYKCDLCHGEKEQACVAACPNEAIRLVDPEADITSKRLTAINATEALDSPSINTKQGE